MRYINFYRVRGKLDLAKIARIMDWKNYTIGPGFDSGYSEKPSEIGLESEIRCRIAFNRLSIGNVFKMFIKFESAARFFLRYLTRLSISSLLLAHHLGKIAI